jgi:hypothetical protein
MPHSAFEHLRSHPIPALRLEFQEYRHRATGARHLHLAADDPHNAFMVAFLTVPQDSTGVAHILEHTALCGSRRYPVRDPFFMMIRRSLNTFMNAFTSSDWTAYPFASQNKKDFNNLLDVYLDADVLPLLDERDFAQEGHRLEFARRRPPLGTAFKGVVFNEMKGAMSSPVQRSAGAATPAVPDHHLSLQQRRRPRGDSRPHLRTTQSLPRPPLPPLERHLPDLRRHSRRRASATFRGASARIVSRRCPWTWPFPTNAAIPRRSSTSPTIPLDDAEELSRPDSRRAGLAAGTDHRPTGDAARARLLSDVLLDNSSSPLRQRAGNLGTRRRALAAVRLRHLHPRSHLRLRTGRLQSRTCRSRRGLGAPGTATGRRRRRAARGGGRRPAPTGIERTGNHRRRLSLWPALADGSADASDSRRGPVCRRWTAIRCWNSCGWKAATRISFRV